MSDDKGWREMFHAVTTYTIVLVLGVSLLEGCGSRSQRVQPAVFGSICLSGLTAVQPGPRGSFFVQVGSRILRFSAHGRLLAQLGTTDATIAADPAGNLYRTQHGDLQKVSPTGTLLRAWPAAGMQPMAVDRQGNLIATDGGGAGSGETLVERFSPTGQLLSRWRTGYGDALAVDGAGVLYGIDAAGGGELAQLDPATRRVVRSLSLSMNHGSVSFDAITTAPDGTVYVGTTINGDVPFAIQKLVQVHGQYLLKTINVSEESVGSLAVDTAGTIWVIRSSYARPGPTNSGLDVLSAHGHRIGTFRSCPSRR